MISEARKIELGNSRKDFVRMIEETEADRIETDRLFDVAISAMLESLRVFDEDYKKESV